MTETLQSPYLYGIFNERSRQTRQRLTASKANVPDKEVTDMPFEAQYTDSESVFKFKSNIARGVQA
ncbi:hypothetical protein SUAG_00027 [Sulfitobacter phage pCB2047-A]|uniref:hypothetical protein n=1 Tax=Sulfitobacter phage pCB2047-A TaxID=754045 RepID=UPI0002C1440D|nr:hypothetical protein SUAG_00027 [Sulfitobacter phage pCB2047-A]AGH30753.1 hypothetical protein SUAG_00027 [Sulfitobacter phage pCB2047-A]